jgi:hypothetical protein
MPSLDQATQTTGQVKSGVFQKHSSAICIEYLQCLEKIGNISITPPKKNCFQNRPVLVIKMHLQRFDRVILMTFWWYCGQIHTVWRERESSATEGEYH